MADSIRAVALMFPISCAVVGQSAPSLPTFEVTSVKPVRPGDARGSTFQFTPGGGLKVTNGTLKGIIEMAYDVRDFQISGGPGWLSSQPWDISASSASDGGMNETRRRLQALLAQRFQLKVHRETRELTAYALTVGKTGSKLAEGSASSTPAGIRRACGQMIGTKASMANLALYLSRQLERPVLDRTGLSGRYDFQLDWTPDSVPCPASTGSPDGPSIFTELQEKLGLKLESTKSPVEIIVIDDAEKADDN
jgi:bla regulator protein blaR1